MGAEGRRASDVVHEAVRGAAAMKVATVGSRVVALATAAVRDVEVPPTSSVPHAQRLGERIDAGAPLTPLADPEVGQGRLDAWGRRPSSVGDLLAARDVEGRRVATDVEYQCALEAARVAPGIADELLAADPTLGAELAAEQLLDGRDGDQERQRWALVAEVAALLTLEVVTRLADELAEAPLPGSVPPR